MLDAFEKLLKAFSLETKSVVNEAIDLFVQKIFAHQKDKNEPMALLPKYTRKVLIEEGQTLRAPAQLSHVVQVIHRHGDLFYESVGKENLLSLLISIMTRLSTSNLPDQKQLAIKLATLLVEWQKRSLASDPSKPFIEKKYGEQILHFVIRIMTVYYSSDNQASASERFGKCKMILKDIFENKLWESENVAFQDVDPRTGRFPQSGTCLNIRTQLIVRHLELDSSEDKANQGRFLKKTAKKISLISKRIFDKTLLLKFRFSFIKS